MNSERKLFVPNRVEVEMEMVMKTAIERGNVEGGSSDTRDVEFEEREKKEEYGGYVRSQFVSGSSRKVTSKWAVCLPRTVSFSLEPLLSLMDNREAT
ncbi:hypothetical protein LXL04_030744 [Taraxacum kok-saghyz]